MQDNMQPAMQPFIKLAQSNMELFTKLFQQGQGSTANFAQSNALAQLTQGMIKNYSEFMVELGQNTTAMIAEGQAAMMRQAQEVSDNVVDATEARGRRARH